MKYTFVVEGKEFELLAHNDNLAAEELARMLTDEFNSKVRVMFHSGSFLASRGGLALTLNLTERRATNETL